MKAGGPFVTVLLMLAACEPQTSEEPTITSPDTAAPAPRSSTPPAEVTQLRWAVAGGSEGAHAHLLAPDGTMVLSLGCRLGSGRLEVSVPGLTRIGSEDRLSLGFGDDSIALAADMTAPGKGVHATGAVPPDIVDQLTSATAIGVAYGNQNLGPYQPPSSDEARAMATACTPAADRSEP